MRVRESGKGFTLLELIIVVLVIGILASIALPRYIRLAEKGRIAEAKSLLGLIRSAQMRYGAEKATFTGTITALDINLTTPKYFTLASIAQPATVADTGTIATAARNTVDNPGLGSYVINITVGGTIGVTGNTTPFSDLL